MAVRVQFLENFALVLKRICIEVQFFTQIIIYKLRVVVHKVTARKGFDDTNMLCADLCKQYCESANSYSLKCLDAYSKKSGKELPQINQLCCLARSVMIKYIFSIQLKLFPVLKFCRHLVRNIISLLLSL